MSKNMKKVLINKHIVDTNLNQQRDRKAFTRWRHDMV